MGKLSSREYFLGLCKHDSQVINGIYEEFSPKVIHFVRSNNGTIVEARDIMQEALLIIYQKYCGTPDKWQSFGGLLFNIVRYKWMDKLKEKNIVADIRNDLFLRYIDEKEINQVDPDLSSIDQLENHCWEKTFSQLSDLCQRILHLKYVQEASGSELAAALSLNASNTAYQRVFDCRSRWRRLFSEQCKN